MTAISSGLWPARLLLAALLLVVALPAGAQEPSRAGLVVQFDEAHVETFCFEVPVEGAKGLDLLQDSGLELSADVSSGMGVSVCQIEGQGCAYPAQHCFCQCMGGGECGYWNYFYRDPGAETWTYSPLGAVLHSVLPGSVEAWVWGDGTAPPAVNLTFEAICQPVDPGSVELPGTPVVPGGGTAVVAESATPAVPGGGTTVVAPSATPTVLAGETALTGESAEPAGTAVVPGKTATAAPGSVTPASGVGSYIAFGAMLLLLAGAGLAVWLRRA